MFSPSSSIPVSSILKISPIGYDIGYFLQYWLLCFVENWISSERENNGTTLSGCFVGYNTQAANSPFTKPLGVMLASLYALNAWGSCLSITDK